MRRNNRASVHGLLILVAVILFAAAPSFSQVGLDTKKLDAMFDILESNNRMMGSVTLRQSGKVIYSRVLGERKIEADGKLKSDANTLFRIGSMTKPFTSVMIFQLIEEGKLTLDTKLSRFFPAIPNADKISIEQLLSHRSGLAPYPQNVNYADPAEWIYKPQTRADMLARFAAAKPIFAPGERRQYSNTNFAILAYVIEDLTRSTYAAQLQKRITKKLGLKNTRFGTKIDITKNEARSYNYSDGKWNSVLEQDTSIAGGAGGMVSTTGDLTAFLDALFHDRLLKRETLKEMLTPPPDNFSDHGKAFGRANLFETGRKGYSHDGGIDNFSSLFVYVKEDDLAFAITVNGVNYPVNRIFWNVLKVFYNQPLTLPYFTAVTLTDAELAKYEGTYALKQAGMKITIRRENGRLIGEVAKDDTFELTPTGNHTFFHAPSGIIIEFKESPPDKFPNFTLHQGRGSSVWEKE